jgi:hypothetical protein
MRGSGSRRRESEEGVHTGEKANSLHCAHGISRSGPQLHIKTIVERRRGDCCGVQACWRDRRNRI